MRLPAAALALGFAVGEAWIAAEGAWIERLSAQDAATAVLGTALVALAAALPSVWCLDALLRTTGARRLGAGLHDGFGGGSRAFTALVFGAALGVGVAGSSYLASYWFDVMSPGFAALATALVATLAPVLLVPLFAAATHRLGTKLRPESARGEALDRALAPWLGGAAVAALLARQIGPAYAAAPGLASAALGAALFGAARSRSLGRSMLALFTTSIVAVAALDHLPPAGAAVLAYRTPYVGPTIGAAQRAFDADGDGFARALLGGDCDDGNARIHPGAREKPDNRVDENCSGKDAPRYRPSREPPGAAPTPGAPHDLVLIFVDALRPDHLSLSGYARKTSSHLDGLAAEGTWFRHAYTTAPTTRFAMASLFTGRDIRRLRHRDLGGNNFVLLPGAPVFADRLRTAGYRTLGFTVSYVIQHNVGTGQGFDVWKTPWPVRDWATVRDRNAELTTQAALDALSETDPGQRYLLFAHYDCPHDPYRKHAPWDWGDRPVDRYDSAVAYCDAQIGRLLTALRARPTWNRTAVAVVSDHGELFGEHGLTNHGNSLYEPDVRITMILRTPSTPPSVVDTPVQLHDVAPTFLALAGLPPDPGQDARSLLGLAAGNPPTTPRPLFMRTELERVTVRYEANAVLDWPLKLVRDERTGASALYDVAADPGEQRSLTRVRPEAAGRLADLLDGYEAWAVP